MRLAGVIFTCVIVAFWMSMNFLVVQRQRELKNHGQYRAGVTHFLGSDLLRERWLGVYRDHKKIGYTGYVYEKVFEEQGVEIHCTLESRMRMDVLGKQVPLRLDGTATLDGELSPLQLQIDVVIGEGFPLSLTGTPDGDTFNLVLRQGALKIMSLSIPREELFIGDGLAPSLPVAGFEVGDTYKVPYFDPVAMSRSLVQVHVAKQEIREVNGMLTDVFRLDTKYGNMTSTSWVTTTGLLLKQTFGPPLEEVELRKETRANARRFFKK